MMKSKKTLIVAFCLIATGSLFAQANKQTPPATITTTNNLNTKAVQSGTFTVKESKKTDNKDMLIAEPVDKSVTTKHRAVKRSSIVKDKNVNRNVRTTEATKKK